MKADVRRDSGRCRAGQRTAVGGRRVLNPIRRSRDIDIDVQEVLEVVALGSDDRSRQPAATATGRQPNQGPPGLGDVADDTVSRSLRDEEWTALPRAG